MWISTILGSILFITPRDTILGLTFSLAPDPCNGIEYHMFWGAHTQMNAFLFLYNTI